MCIRLKIAHTVDNQNFETALTLDTKIHDEKRKLGNFGLREKLMVEVRLGILNELKNLDWWYIQNVLTVLRTSPDAILSTLRHFKKFHMVSKMLTKYISVMNLAITMFYNPQIASFMHILSPVNAIEGDYVTFGHFVKPKTASKMADSMFTMKMPYFSRLVLCFAFLKAQTCVFQKMIDISTHMSLFNI